MDNNSSHGLQQLVTIVSTVAKNHNDEQLLTKKWQNILLLKISFSEFSNHISSLLVIINASTNVFIYLWKHDETLLSIEEMVKMI